MKDARHKCIAKIMALYVSDQRNKNAKVITTSTISINNRNIIVWCVYHPRPPSVDARTDMILLYFTVGSRARLFPSKYLLPRPRACSGPDLWLAGQTTDNHRTVIKFSNAVASAIQSRGLLAFMCSVTRHIVRKLHKTYRYTVIDRLLIYYRAVFVVGTTFTSRELCYNNVCIRYVINDRRAILGLMSSVPSV